MSGYMSWDPAEDPAAECDFLAMELTGDEGPGGANPVAAQVALWLREALRELSRKQMKGENGGISQQVSDTAGLAAETFVAAFEGRLKKASLEGELMKAEILKLFADMRVANATAAKILEETEQVRLANARARLENAIVAARAFGLDVRVLMSPSQSPTVAAAGGPGTETRVEAASSAQGQGEAGAGDVKSAPTPV